MIEKRFTIIDMEEPRGQSVAEKGIPCSARHCCTRLNRLTEENEQLKQQLSEQGTQIDFLKDENTHMRNVLNENKQLKEEIKNLNDVLARYEEELKFRNCIEKSAQILTRSDWEDLE